MFWEDTEEDRRVTYEPASLRSSLANGFAAISKLTGRPAKLYESVDVAVAARNGGTFNMNAGSAKALCLRGGAVADTTGECNSKFKAEEF